MNATLTTRCGAQRQMRVTYPPPKEIYIPLRPQTSLFHLLQINDDDDVTKPKLGIRVFELYSVNGNLVDYIETKEFRRP